MEESRCKNCGAKIIIQNNLRTAQCEYCGSVFELDNNRNHFTSLYSAADDAWDRKDFDEALKYYFQIIQKDNLQSEAHWGIALCRYGIAYETDPISGTKKPTCNRINNESILDDKNYLAAIKYASDENKKKYIERATEIDRISVEFFKIVKSESPYDVFISYKRTDERGLKTIEAEYAMKLYLYLRNNGIKVFFAEETLKDVAGSQYEPYIFSALQSAKVMVLIGSSKENIESAWVKNEWQRFLKIMESSPQKTLIPAYIGNPYEVFPQRFQHIQAVNAGSPVFVEEMLEYIKKKLAVYEHKTKKYAKNVNNRKNSKGSSRLKRIIISIILIILLVTTVTVASIGIGLGFIVKNYNEKYSVDNLDIVVVEKVVKESYRDEFEFKLIFSVENKGNVDVVYLVGNFKIYNANGECLFAEMLSLNGTVKPGNMLHYDVNFSLSDTAKNREIYDTDLSGLKMTYQLTEVEFENYKEKEYKNSDVIVLCDVKKEYVDSVNASVNSYEAAVALFNQGKYAETLSLFKALGDYKDSNDYYIKSVYHNALNLFSQEKYGEAYSALKEINGYEDTGEKMSEITAAALAKAETVAATGDYLAACKIIEQVDFDESSLLHQAYTYASQGYFADAVEYGLTVVVIPEGTESIPDNYFKIEYGSNKLKKVVLPSTLKRIGKSAFYGCTKLEEINFPEGLQVIGSYAFFNCKSLKTIEIPNSMESMGSNAFQECTGLQSVSISGNLKTVPSYAFKDCTSLSTVTLKNGIEVLDIGAFSGCSGLMDITFSESLVTIESNVFYMCTSMLEITIPSKVKLIRYSAFSSCSSLQRVHFANQEGWQNEYGSFNINVTNAQNNAKNLRDVTASTWERK